MVTFEVNTHDTVGEQEASIATRYQALPHIHKEAAVFYHTGLALVKAEIYLIDGVRRLLLAVLDNDGLIYGE